MTYKYIKWFDEISKEDIPIVGGKGANLGELTQKGVSVPPGFCITAKAYSDFISKEELGDKIRRKIEGLDIEDSAKLQMRSLEIRDIINNSPMPNEIKEEIERAYKEFSIKTRIENPFVAVRSSATAEDLPEASFAGQQDTYLHISRIDEVLRYTRKCWASLWTARAIYYREKQNFDHFQVSLSVVIQKMINSEKSGVMFTANPITNDVNQLMINASWGLGEAVVSGTVSPDEYILDKCNKKVVEKHISEKVVMVVKNEEDIGTVEVRVSDFLGYDFINKQCLTEEEIDELAEYGIKIENIYENYEDIEWGFDKDTKKLYILQARPITTLKNRVKKEVNSMGEKKELNVLTKGLSASPGIACGNVKNISNISEISRIEDGDVIVTVMTNPDMVPAMRRARAVVTDEGGRTCHAAIVSRELGIPCIVGTKTATETLKEGMSITVDATRGVVYEGKVFKKEKEDTGKSDISSQNPAALDNLVYQLSPITATKIYMNLGEPSIINRYKELPFDGIGLMRTEFIFTNMIGAHPMYLVKTNQGKVLIDKMSEGITTVAQAIYPKPIVVRLSDFRTNEFRGLKGGDEVEPVENNPMIGWRGVSRYISPEYEEGFRLECRALKKVREEYGLTNVWAMLPFVRTTWELVKVKEIMASEGLVQGNNFKLWIMAEVPSVVFEAEEFAQLVDGFSIGSNDLTQLIMGADRDSGILNNMGYFDERNEAVKKAISILIKATHKYGKTISICGQGPSQYPEFAEFLVQEGIDSMSVNPDTVNYTRRLVASVEQRIILKQARKLK
ncbi:phosphoenolpyruvate synthase [Acidilutibacter cellobiosedens]|jgi:pyruvate,water dikinase|uniref:Phosphoenolpyruvate synthase n=1 Tax=Acidilutibacter cellobiosedens TaxID=2507161 RepID=A0A410QBN0_9FIRM|nr:phosphoenolpyruvate synthase [Acidilutibacter cellobiosedens]MBE6081929.1 phosphoenolpyruvate synthase [Tissierellaceae bacterium]QAT61268.1 phosphoenolpyruvate synthase [Acidilutibacter cellobiosedens]